MPRICAGVGYVAKVICYFRRPFVMATWGCPRCFRNVRAHRQFCLCGQEQSPELYGTAYKGGKPTKSKGKGWDNGKGKGWDYQWMPPSAIAKRQPRRPSSQSRKAIGSTDHDQKLYEMNKATVWRVLSKIPMAAPTEAEAHPEWLPPPKTDDSTTVGNFRWGMMQNLNSLAMVAYAAAQAGQ